MQHANEARPEKKEQPM